MKRVLIPFLVLAMMPIFSRGEPVKTGWGSVLVPDAEEQAARRELRVEKWPENGALPLPIPFPNIVRAWVEGKDGVQLLGWSFNKDATEIKVVAPEGGREETVHVLTAEASAKQANGALVLSALDAKVVGEKAALESHPGNHRVGFWVNGGDYVEWDLEVGESAGMYDVELVYSRAGGAGAEAAVKIGAKELPVRLRSTGTWYVYQVQRIGEVEIGGGTSLHVEVRSTKQSGAVMNLKAVLLHPKAG